MVEVDASDVGVGGILSQRSPEDNKLHPCAFLSRRLSPAERNYDVGNYELFAIKVAPEEWRHWLEGAEIPFLVWTDHKNLEYIRSDKRLNSRQARWTLFFTRLKFTLSYHPGSKNVKPDALSRRFDPSSAPRSPSNILPPSCVIGAVTWGIERKVRQANVNSHVPEGCPPNRLFVVSPCRSLTHMQLISTIVLVFLASGIYLLACLFSCWPVSSDILSAQRHASCSTSIDGQSPSESPLGSTHSYTSALPLPTPRPCQRHCKDLH